MFLFPGPTVMRYYFTCQSAYYKIRFGRLVAAKHLKCATVDEGKAHCGPQVLVELSKGFLLGSPLFSLLNCKPLHQQQKCSVFFRS